MACECGCEWEGEDDVAQFCIEEALLIALDRFEAAQIEADRVENAKPGEITDPVMQNAMEKVKELHRQRTGARV